MFIRSQNRDVLVNVNDICFNKLNIHSEIIYQFRCYVYGDDYYILGEYSTKEKALKVLDEIHSILDANEWDISDLRVVFEMPADEDVEV